VSPEPGVVSQVEADVIRIFINDALIRSPQPVGAQGNIRRGDTEIKPVEPESIRTSAREPPHMSLSESAGEVAVRPGLIDMVTGIVRSAIMAHPLIVLVDVGSLRVTGLIGKTAF